MAVWGHLVYAQFQAFDESQRLLISSSKHLAVSSYCIKFDLLSKLATQSAS